MTPGKMDSKLHFVTTPTADTPGTTLVLATPKRNYLFGSQSEGTQRAITQMGHRLVKVKDYFLTGRCEWQNTGGLLGTTLTLADTTSTAYESAMETYHQAKKKGRNLPEPVRPSMHIYGPPNLKHLLSTCRRFIFRKGMPIVATEYKSEPAVKTAQGEIQPTWQDDIINVWAFSIKPRHDSADSRSEMAQESRKKAFDADLNVFDDFQAPKSESAEERETRYDRIRTTVLNQMFDSKWSFDTLVERHISEVEMPAAVFVRNPETNLIEKYQGPLPGGQEPLPDIRVLTRTPWPAALVTALPPTTPAPDSVCYIVRTHAARGKFDVDRAKELGIPQGRLYTTLAAGESVTLQSGKVITPDMVLGPDRPGQGFAILDVPSVDYLEDLVEREELISSNVMQGVNTCVWILGSGVAGHPLFHQFTKKLSEVKHILSTSDTCPTRLSFDSVAAQTIRLGQIDPDRYQAPYHDNDTLPQKSFRGEAASEGTAPSDALIADRGLKMNIMPRFVIDNTTIPPPLDTPTVQSQTSPDIIEEARIAHEKIKSDRETLQAWRQLVASPDTEVITLGTGSALPSKYRNVSATLVRVPGVGNYLFDAGENTLGQLQRMFRPEELRDVLQNLRVIWISHLHADHHLGTASVIKAWYAVVHNSVPADRSPSDQTLKDNLSTYGLSVISHVGMLKWLQEYSDIEDFGYSRILPFFMQAAPHSEDTGSRLVLQRGAIDKEPLSQDLYEPILGLSDIQAVRVSHCHGAMAVSLTFPSSPGSPTLPLKISYSGDCRPSNDFTLIGKDTTVLIHEATFDDELQGDARAKKHSTTSEALGIGARMNAKAVVLTHFSQRYQKIPVLQTVSDGDVEDELLAPDAVEDPKDEGGDEGEDDIDVEMADDPETIPATRSTAAPSAPPAALKRENTQEKVIKVRNRDMKVAIAFDYMRVKIGDIACLDRFNDALNKLLVDDEDEGDNLAEDGQEGKKSGKDKGKGKDKGNNGKGKGKGAGTELNGNGKKNGDGKDGGRNKKPRRNN